MRSIGAPQRTLGYKSNETGGFVGLIGPVCVTLGWRRCFGVRHQAYWICRVCWQGRGQRLVAARVAYTGSYPNVDRRVC